MEIVLEKMDTVKKNIDYVKEELEKIKASGKESGRIKLSLDLNHPEYIDVVVRKGWYDLHYWRGTADNVECITDHSVTDASMEEDIAAMFVVVKCLTPKETEKVSEKTITKAQLLDYLQYLMDEYQEAAKRYGKRGSYTIYKYDAMVACKGMVESLTQEKVNLGEDGKVAFGS